MRFDISPTDDDISPSKVLVSRSITNDMLRGKIRSFSFKYHILCQKCKLHQSLNLPSIFLFDQSEFGMAPLNSLSRNVNAVFNYKGSR